MTNKQRAALITAAIIANNPGLAPMGGTFAILIESELNKILNPGLFNKVLGWFK